MIRFSFRTSLFVRIALVALALGVGAASAWADATFVLCNSNSVEEIDGTPAQGATCSTQNGSGQIFASANVAEGGNSLQATLTQNVNFGNNFFNFDARAVSDYTVTVSGPGGPTIIVPIDIAASGSASASSASSADAGSASSIAVNSSGLPGAFACAGADMTRVCNSSSFGGVFVYNTFVIGGVGSFTVDLTTDAFADSLGGTASASLDPYIYIDPTFLASNPGYSLTFSDGVANTPPSSPVPEPSTFLLLGSSILATAGTLRRRLKL